MKKIHNINVKQITDSDGNIINEEKEFTYSSTEPSFIKTYLDYKYSKNL